MILKESIPHDEMSMLIESYWESTNSGKVLLASEGTFHIIYSPSPFVISYHKTYFLHSGFYLFPINVIPIHINHINKLTGIRLKAFTYCNISNNAKIFSIKNTAYWMFNENSTIIKYCTMILNRESTLDKPFQHLEVLLHKMLLEKPSLNSSLRDEVNYILDRKGQIKVSKMAKDFGVSRQYLYKYFVKHLDISPKQLSAIWNINDFVYLSNKQKTLTESAHSAGYFDQSHCIREFKKHFNHSPKYLHSKDMLFTKDCIRKRFTNQYNPK